MEYHLIGDELLVKLLRVDDEGAFTEIYKRFWKNLFKAGQAKLKSDETVEEVLQEVFLSLWEKRATVQIDNLGGYLFTILKYQIINHYRKQMLADRYSEYIFAKPDSSIQSIDNEVHFKEIIAIFENVLLQLPEKTRKIFQMSRVEFKSTREISEALDMPERTVEYHITQSLKLLRFQLKDFLPMSFIVFLLQK